MSLCLENEPYVLHNNYTHKSLLKLGKKESFPPIMNDEYIYLLHSCRDSKDHSRLGALMGRTLAETRSGLSRGKLTGEEASVVKECGRLVDEKTEDHLVLIKSQEVMECFVPRLFPAQYQKLSECVKSKKDVDYCANEATEVVDLWARFLSKAGHNISNLEKETHK